MCPLLAVSSASSAVMIIMGGPDAAMHGSCFLFD